MDLNIDVLLIIVAGGLFGVVLGKFLDETPDWVFYLIVLILFVLVIYLLVTGGDG